MVTKKKLSDAAEEAKQEWDAFRSDIPEQVRKAGDGMADFLADKTDSRLIDEAAASGKLSDWVLIGCGLVVVAGLGASLLTGNFGFFGVSVIVVVGLLFYVMRVR